MRTAEFRGRPGHRERRLWIERQLMHRSYVDRAEGDIRGLRELLCSSHGTDRYFSCLIGKSRQHQSDREIAHRKHAGVEGSRGRVAVVRLLYRRAQMSQAQRQHPAMEKRHPQREMTPAQRQWRALALGNRQPFLRQRLGRRKLAASEIGLPQTKDRGFAPMPTAQIQFARTTKDLLDLARSQALSG